MRIRTIKPEFFTHEGIFDAEQETQLPLRIAFIGLWCAADREGRFKWEPRRLGVQILPYDQHDFSRVLDALTTRGFIQKYEAQGGIFGVIPSFKDHQAINNKEKDSSLPEPPKNQALHAMPTRELRVEDACHKEGKGREQGKEGNSNITPLPPRGGTPQKPRKKFQKPTPIEVNEYGATLSPAFTRGAEFCDFYEAKGWVVGKSPMKDWKAAVRTWQQKQRENAARQSNYGVGHSPAPRRDYLA